MKATSLELLMRNFNEIFIELDPVKRINEAAAAIRKHFAKDHYTATLYTFTDQKLSALNEVQR